MYCSKCGKEIAENSEFCQHCGQKVNSNSYEYNKGDANGKKIKELSKNEKKVLDVVW